jgi:hypothetical protein
MAIYSKSAARNFILLYLLKKKMVKEYITKKNYDLGRGEIVRIVRTLLCGKIMPIGNLGSNTRLRGLFILLFVHAFGRIIFPMLVPFEDKLHRLYQQFDNAQPEGLADRRGFSGS